MEDHGCSLYTRQIADGGKVQMFHISDAAGCFSAQTVQELIYCLNTLTVALVNICIICALRSPSFHVVGAVHETEEEVDFSDPTYTPSFTFTFSVPWVQTDGSDVEAFDHLITLPTQFKPLF